MSLKKNFFLGGDVHIYVVSKEGAVFAFILI